MIYKEIKIPANATAADICQAVGVQCRISEKSVVVTVGYNAYAVCTGLALPQMVIIGYHEDKPAFVGGMVWTK